ncbi:MAG: acetyl-CoA carboxylase biotin carboxyl carrier protein subunit [Flavobacteriales bacterium]|nr:acetyl-CoA carboxylase biotin carboxyl carrier protein subunit [Flavobacteriales bacterium]
MTMKVENAFDQLLHSMGLDDLISKKVNEVKAPMPGKVLAIHVEDGSEVKEGDSLLVLEAMKMENVIKSPVDATVRQIRVKAGGTVEKNEILIEF